VTKIREAIMRSISEILNLVTDGFVKTQARAAEIIEEEAADRETFGKVTVEEARAVLLENIGYMTGYMSPEQGDRIMELFNTEHPIWGRNHPTPEEALRLGIEYGSRGVKGMERPIEDQKSK
jgi:hypothetical protein